jgi:putative exporter of polyketide antibiotics
MQQSGGLLPFAGLGGERSLFIIESLILAWDSPESWFFCFPLVFPYTLTDWIKASILLALSVFICSVTWP